MNLTHLIQRLNHGCSYALTSYPDQSIPIGIAVQADDLIFLACDQDPN